MCSPAVWSSPAEGTWSAQSENDDDDDLVPFHLQNEKKTEPLNKSQKLRITICVRCSLNKSNSKGIRLIIIHHISTISSESSLELTDSLLLLLLFSCVKCFFFFVLLCWWGLFLHLTDGVNYCNKCTHIMNERS